MTPSYNKLILISLVIAFAAAQPSAAVRAEGSEKAHAVAPAPTQGGGAHQLPTASLFPPGFPCFSFLPPILLQLCHALFPQPSPSPPAPPAWMVIPECGSWLARMKPCADFLSNGSVSMPSDECCDGLDSINDEGATICYCRLAVGDVGQVLPTPMNLKRLYKIPRKCDSPVTLEAFAHCSMKYVPPIYRPSPPPSDDDDYTD